MKKYEYVLAFEAENDEEAMGLDKVEGGNKYGGVVFPMVELDVKPNISWIIGMENGLWYIEQALQQTRFRMNEKGAKVESATAMQLRCKGASAEPDPAFINHPFLLWIERPGLPVPIFCAVLCEDVWKEPKSL